MASPSDAHVLTRAPFLFGPTRDGVEIALVFEGPADPTGVRISVESTSGTHRQVFDPIAHDADTLHFRLHGLEGGTRHRYQVQAGPRRLAQGSFRTAPTPGTAFGFDVFTDSHVFVRNFDAEELHRYPLPDDEIAEYREQKEHCEQVLPLVAANVLADAPDFVVHLGDVLDFHSFGDFNDPPPDDAFVRSGFLDYRRMLGELPAHVPHALALGNWDGENGDYAVDAVRAARAHRLRYLPNPGPNRYPEGGGPNHDYFAWRWGDALLIVLNVMSYTPGPHRLRHDPGRADDWTLGEAQRTWLQTTLQASDARFKFVFIHHAVGGAGPDPANAAYGRGGGLAAHVGEQAVVHALMRRYGVQVFFYGHDHLFTDIVVDDIHYTLAGRAGTNWLFDPSIVGYTETWPDSGHVRVRVTPVEATVEMVNVDQVVLHAFTVR